MVSVSQTCAQLQKEVLRAVEKASDALYKKGFWAGARVCHERGIFRICRIETNYYHQYGTVRVTLHGHKLRKDNTFGDHEHYIGRADEVTLM